MLNPENLTDILSLFTSINQWVMQALHSVKIFYVEFHFLYVLRSLASKKKEKWFWKTVLCGCDCVRNIQRFISQKLIKLETPNFMHSTRYVRKRQYFQVLEKIPEVEYNEPKMSISKTAQVFLQTRYINVFLHAF